MNPISGNPSREGASRNTSTYDTHAGSTGNTGSGGGGNTGGTGSGGNTGGGGGTTDPTTGGADSPWFIMRKKFQPPPLDPNQAKAYADAVLGGGRQLALATLVSDTDRSELITIRKNFNPKITEELIRAWKLNPKLVPAGVDAKDVEQQFTDCDVINNINHELAQVVQWGDNTLLIRQAMVSQATSEGVTYALAQVDAEVQGGGKSTEAIQATTGLRASLNKLAQQQNQNKKGRQQAEQRGSLNLEQIQSENLTLHTQTDAQRQHIHDLEQLIAQSGISLPVNQPPSAILPKGHRTKPRSVTPATHGTGTKRPPPKSTPRLTGPNASRRKAGR